MAWYFGTYLCGHEGRTQIYGPEDGRQHKADWHFGSLICKDCWLKKKLEEKKKAYEQKAKDVKA
jgi:hypothetical protein